MEMEAPVPRQRHLDALRNRKMGIVITLLILLNILALIEILGCRSNTQQNEDITTTEQITTIPVTLRTQIKSTTTETESTTTEQEIIIRRKQDTTTKLTTTTKPTTTENEVVKNLLEMLKN